MKNVTRSASGGVSGARLFQERVFEHVLISAFDVLAPFDRFGVPLWPHWIFKGIPESHFFAKDQHEMRKKEVPEGVPTKHDF